MGSFSSSCSGESVFHVAWDHSFEDVVFHSGRNPFDDGTREEDSRWLLSGRGSSISDDDDESQTSTRTENHVKKRIVRGIVEFKDTVWEGLDEGE